MKSSAGSDPPRGTLVQGGVNFLRAKMGVMQWDREVTGAPALGAEISNLFQGVDFENLVLCQSILTYR